MRPRTEIPAAPVGAIHRAMLAAPNQSAFQRLQCLWRRAHRDLATEAIAQAVGLSVSHVRRVWSEYLRGGLTTGQGRPKGGRHHQNLTLAQERSLLAPWQPQARGGQLVTARGIKVAYEKRLRRAVPDSTVCRLLARHQWRRVTPRPKPPKDNPAARAAFKKTSGQSGRGGGWAPAPAVASGVRG
jgi:transposase